MVHRCLLLAAIVFACSAAVRAQTPYVDTRRGFEITLDARWTRLAPTDSARIDPLASIAWQRDGGDTYLAVECRRLPGLDLRSWSVRWASSASDRSRMGRLRARSSRVFAVTSESVDGKPMLIASEFHRSGTWAYRVSAYRPLRSPAELRGRLRETAATFRPRPVETDAGPMPTDVTGGWRKDGVAATLQTSGWRPLDPASPQSILPAELDVALLDDVHGYQGGLAVLGEVASLEQLAVRVHSFTAQPGNPEGTRLLRIGDHLEGLCVGRIGEGRRMVGLPAVWLLQAHRIAGQGVLLFAGLVGFDLAGDREQLRAFFDRLGDRADWPAPDAVAMRRGRVIAPDARFQLALPATWSVGGPDRALSPLRIPGRPILVGLRDDERRDPARSATFFAVLRHRGRSPLFDGAVHDAVGPARIVAGDEITFDGSFTTARDYRVWARDAAGGGWRVAGRELITPGGGTTLLIGHPDDATDRLASEVARLQSAFGPYDAGAISGAASIEFDGMRVRDGVWADGLRGLTATLGPGWIWFDGDLASDLDEGATVAAQRERSRVAMTLVTRYAPGVTAREWALSQRLADVREGRGERLTVDARSPGVHLKSIVGAQHGWCTRFTARLPETADGASRAAAFGALRSLDGLEDDARVRLAATRTRSATPGERMHDDALGVRLRPIPDWIGAATPEWFPFQTIFAVRDPVRQRWVFAVESRPSDDNRTIGIATEALLRALPAGDVTAAARRRGTDIVVEGAARLPAHPTGATLPSRWVVRVFRAPRGAVAVLAGQYGRALSDEDRGALFEATQMVTPRDGAPAAEK